MRFFFLVTVALLGVVDLAIAAPPSEVASVAKRDGGFTNNCIAVSLSGWTLKADCQISTGSYIATSLDLKECLGWGAGGYILCQPEEADAYQVCEKLSLSGSSTLTATCSNASGGSRTSSTNLDTCVSNNQGSLVCPLG